MQFLFIFSILFVLIITNKLFLFNEEFLILLSFIGFCVVINEHLAPIINSRFEDKITLIKNSLLNSLNSLFETLSQNKLINNKLINLNIIFNSLKKYYLLVTYKFLKNYLNYLKIKEKTNLINKLIEFKQLEKDYLKFIILLILKKIKVLNNLNKFYSKYLQIKRFQTINLINKLNLINQI
uniref:ATP synthase F1 subunit 4 n=1 Tax=Dipterosiphonia australica TaxID=2007208 RepID=UPI0022FD437E|nr:ATP synthase F1 subunit 4 [Dipterosiphonia australica]WAX04230.1 ATP synthase F1 subunit 4 [Dipterosiphonia australica]